MGGFFLAFRVKNLHWDIILGAFVILFNLSGKTAIKKQEGEI
jgi:hypothetical protein